MVELGSGAEREVEDTMLTRYACYLVAQNGGLCQNRYGKVYKIENKRRSYAEIANELNKLTAINAFQTIFYNPKVRFYFKLNIHI